MIRTLFISMGELNKGARRPAGVPATSIKKVGVLGAGFMGAGVAYVTANAGMEVVLVDQTLEAAEKGKAYSHKLMTDQVMKGRAKTADRDALLARITPSADYNDLKDVDLIVEAVFEDPKVKAEAIAKAEAVIRPDAIFGSNTSTLPISGLAKTSKRPADFIGIHFFSPVERMMLVEIIMGRGHRRQGARGGARLCPRHQEDADRRQRRPRLLRQPLRRRLHPRRPPDADRGRAGGDDRERRPHGRHAGRAAVAQRRGRDRPGAEDRQGDEGAGRRGGRQPGAGEAPRRDGRGRGPARTEEQEGLLRLSRERAEAPLAGPQGPAGDAARSRHARRRRR